MQKVQRLRGQALAMETRERLEQTWHMVQLAQQDAASMSNSEVERDFVSALSIALQLRTDLLSLSLGTKGARAAVDNLLVAVVVVSACPKTLAWAGPRRWISHALVLLGAVGAEVLALKAASTKCRGAGKTPRQSSTAAFARELHAQRPGASSQAIADAVNTKLGDTLDRPYEARSVRKALSRISKG